MKLIALVLSVVLVPPSIVMVSRTTNAQTPQTADPKPEKKDEGVCKGHHRSKKDFYSNVRMFPPAAVFTREKHAGCYGLTVILIS